MSHQCPIKSWLLQLTRFFSSRTTRSTSAPVTSPSARLSDEERRRIVVFIDDLDRCLPEGALTVLESMKLFFDLEGFVFVVGLDNQVIEKAIDSKYALQYMSLPTEEKTRYYIRGSECIKKIIQVPFTLFPVTVSEIDRFMEALYEDANLPQEQKADLETIVRPHLDFIVPLTGLNPREIKRYINAYTLLIKIKPKLDRNVVLALQTISFRPEWAVIREDLYVYRQAFIEALRAFFQGDTQALLNLDPRLETLPADFADYVGAPDKPGYLLQGSWETAKGTLQIDDYLYSGTFTINLTVLSLIRDMASLRGRLNDVLEVPNPSANVLQNQIGSLVSQTRRSFNSPLDVFINSIADELDTMTTSAGTILSKSEEQRKAWVLRYTLWISATISRLLRLGSGLTPEAVQPSDYAKPFDPIKSRPGEYTSSEYDRGEKLEAQLQ